jgi:NADPH-dependent stearoyl-CoA 9-desaturase
MEAIETSPHEDDDRERLRRFGEALDALHARVKAEVGDDDVRHVKRLRAVSIACEVTGRALIHFSFEPVGFLIGVVTLWLHKQLEATEIGHTALHGAYDGLPGAERFQSKSHLWRVPIDEESWRYGHNVRHHGATNVAGHDADIHFGPVRLTRETPYDAKRHRFQTLFAALVLFPNFGLLMNAHFTGLSDAIEGNGRGGLDFLKDRSRESVRGAWKKALRKYVPYYAYEYVLFPALAGPFFWKVLLGNWMAETMRDLYSAATIFCGHVGERTKSYPEGTKTRSRGEWYAMQAEASNDFEVPYLVSVLCGGLDRQIEHHLFPKLAPERLRQIAPEVKALCEAHGVEHRTASWPRTLRDAFRWIHALSKDTTSTGGAVRALSSAMA